MNISHWVERLAPDYVATWQRFPFAILLAAANTVVVLAAINDAGWLQDETLFRAAAGLATGAVMAVAGVYFSESRPDAVVARWIVAYGLPLAVVAAFQVTDTGWFVPYVVPAIALLWLSVSPFTRLERAGPREEQQNRFWWINHRAISTAVIAATAIAIIALGLVAIERSLDLLFGWRTGEIFYQWVLPVAGLFLTPVYWLSTLPRISEFRPDELSEPEFLARSVGFLGQFVLVPLLLIYSVILLAYTAQIAISRSMPEGVIGWMVLGFVVIGAAAWLVLHPPFMRTRGLVRLFRRSWFWLTLVPLGLFFLAVWIRVDAYGLTTDRMLLIAGGVWALALAVAFLAGKDDIRLIPGLAGLILLVLSVGPWNYVNLPVLQQLSRLDALIADAGAPLSATAPRANWSPGEAAEARAIIGYLTYAENGPERLRELLGRYGAAPTAERYDVDGILQALGQRIETPADTPRYVAVVRDPAGEPVDVSRTPRYLQQVTLYREPWLDAAGLRLQLVDGALRVEGAAQPPVTVELNAWLNGPQAPNLVEPWLDFSFAGLSYRLVVDSLQIDQGEKGTGPRMLDSLQGVLFVSEP